MRRPQLNALLIGGLVFALLAGIGLSHWLSQSAPKRLDNALVLEPPRELPDYQLQTAQGGEYTKESFSGRWQLLFFGFTHCPDVCPATLAQMKALRMQLPDALRDTLQMVFVTVDPARDTPEALRPYLGHFDESIVGVTGSEEAIESFSQAAGIAYVKVPQGENYTMDHATALVLLGPQARIRAYFPAPHTVDALRKTLEQIIPS